MIDCELLESEWIKLPEAIKFWWSACFPNLPAAANDAAPSITSPWGEDDYTAFVPDGKMTAAAYDFDCNLSKAAFAERVHLKGKRDTDDASNHEPIPFGYFSSPRGFCLDGENIQPLPYPTAERDIFEHAVTNKVTIWHDVLLRRDDFLAWIIEAYPSVVVSIGGVEKSAHEAPQIEIAGPENTKPQAVREVITELWPDGLPAGLSAKKRQDKINLRLHEKGLDHVSARTINRAIEKK